MLISRKNLLNLIDKFLAYKNDVFHAKCIIERKKWQDAISIHAKNLVLLSDCWLKYMILISHKKCNVDIFLNLIDKFSMYKKWFILCKILLKERDNMKDLRDYY